MEQHNADVYQQFVQIAGQLETTYRDMQDLEFTVERGKLYMLQTRSGKRTGRAAVKIAEDMVHEGLITKDEALLRVEPATSCSCCCRASTRRPRAQPTPADS